jgi:hypothetical protein
VNGHRIELREIESALQQHVAVDDAAAKVEKGADGIEFLVVYYVGSAADAGALRRLLSLQLPEYMLPAAIVRLDAMPTTHSGKIDRQALPRVRVPDDAIKSEADPDRPLQSSLVGLWEELLNLPEVRSDADFFASGGSSMLVLVLVALIAERLGFEVPPQWVFEHPTPGTLAEKIASVPLTAR